MWHGFSGEAVATLWGAIATGATGALAVGAAILVGLRQAGISTRQTDILDRQATIMEAQIELERKRVAHELYDRRYKVFMATSFIIIEALKSNNQQPDKDKDNDFTMARWEARFLFPNNVFIDLQEIANKLQERFAYPKSEAFGDTVDAEPQALNAEHAAALRKWFQERMMTLHVLFHQLNIH